MNLLARLAPGPIGMRLHRSEHSRMLPRPSQPTDLIVGLPAEYRFLLDCLAESPPSTPPASSFWWDRLLASAKVHRVAPFLYHQLKPQSYACPQRFFESLRQEYYWHALRQELLISEL